MSSYLNFYLVPKKEKVDCRPLHFLSYSRSSDIYQNYYEYLNPPFIGMDGDHNYEELTFDKAEYVVSKAKKYLEQTRNSFKLRQEAFAAIKNPSKEVTDEFMNDFVQTTSYIQELEETINELKYISNLVSDIKYSDFEKVLFNID